MLQVLTFSFENVTPIENWLLNNVDGLTGSTIALPTEWVQVLQLTNILTVNRKSRERKIEHNNCIL